MSLENDLLMNFSNDVEKYEIEGTKIGQTTHFFYSNIYIHVVCTWYLPIRYDCVHPLAECNHYLVHFYKENMN